MSTWLSRLAAVTNHFMSGEKRRWYGSRMPRSVRCTSAVRGSMKVSESLPALATITECSSGVRYRWCGSLPVGMRWVSTQRRESITLTLPSSELSTNTGAPRRGGGGCTAPWPGTMGAAGCACAGLARAAPTPARPARPSRSRRDTGAPSGRAGGIRGVTKAPRKKESESVALREPQALDLTSAACKRWTSTALFWKCTPSPPPTHRPPKRPCPRWFSSTKGSVRWRCGATGLPACAPLPGAPGGCIHGGAMASPAPCRMCAARRARTPRAAASAGCCPTTCTTRRWWCCPRCCSAWAWRSRCWSAIPTAAPSP